MEETFSTDFKKRFIIAFTAELINHSAKKDIFKLQKIIESRKEKESIIFPERITSPEVIIPTKINPLVTRDINAPPIKVQERSQEIIQPLRRPIIRKQFTRPSLLIPEPKLPAHLEYLKPTPTAGVEIDLGKLNPFIKDPAVRIIESNPDEKVIVTGSMGTKPTDVILNKEDIDRVINKFSEMSKIPTTEGIYRVVVGNLILSAIISEVIGSKFVIKKMINPSSPKPIPAMPNPFPNLR